MQVQIDGSPSFSHLQVVLKSGDRIITESGAMASMDVGIQLESKMKGGFLQAIMRKIFGGESLFINTFRNPTQTDQRLTIGQTTPGDIVEYELNNELIYFQPGAFLCCTPGVKLVTKWAGFASLIAGEGLFRLAARGKGKVWLACFGAIVEKNIKGEYLVDTGHLLAYPPSVHLKLQLAGGIFSSLFGGEGFVARLEGKGKVLIQTRSLGGMVGWLNPRL